MIAGDIIIKNRIFRIYSKRANVQFFEKIIISKSMFLSHHLMFRQKTAFLYHYFRLSKLKKPRSRRHKKISQLVTVRLQQRKSPTGRDQLPHRSELCQMPGLLLPIKFMLLLENSLDKIFIIYAELNKLLSEFYPSYFIHYDYISSLSFSNK